MEEKHQQGAVPVHNNTPDDSAEPSPGQGNVSGGDSLGISLSLYTGYHDVAIDHPQEKSAGLLVAQLRPNKKHEKEQHQSRRVLSTGRGGLLLGTIHAIERCPSDVLQLIFEATCDLSSEPLDSAMSLSAVSRTWRRVALNTPRLWRKIDFMFLPEECDPSPLFTLLIPRIKMVPAVIDIYHLGSGTADLLKRCDLTRVPIFEYLGINLSCPEYFLRLHTLPPFLPAAGTENLLIAYELSQDATAVTWDIGKLLGYIPPISNLWLVAPCTLHVTPSTCLAGITSLYLEKMRGVEMLTVISSFTQLSHLELFQVHFTLITSIKKINSLSLASLTLCYCDGGDSWLGQAKFPALAVFIHTGPGVSDACRSFIQNHNSITTLELSGKGEKLAFIPKIAPQIQSLVVDPWLSHLYKADASGTEVLPFPSLKFLTVISGECLSLEDFDGIVCARCLPSNHSRSQISLSLQPLHSLTIRKYAGSDQPVASEPWKESDLAQSARQEVAADCGLVDWDGVTLSWV